MSIQIENIIAQKGEKINSFLNVGEASTYEVKIPIIIINGIQPGPKLCVLSGIHPVEYTSIEAVLRIAEKIEPKDLKGVLILIPVVNIDGFHARAAFNNSIDYKNQNRVNPGNSNGTMSERVAYTLFEKVISKVDYVVDSHSGDLIEDLDKIVMISETDDFNIKQKMIEMASCYNVEYVQINGPRSKEARNINGSVLVEAPKKYKIPCIAVESGTVYPIREENVRFHYDGIINLMKYLDMLEGKPNTWKQKINPPAQIISANRGGIWRQKVLAGQKVKKDMVLGEISNLFGETLEKIIAPFDGIVDHTRTCYEVNSGDWLLWITNI